MQKTIFTIVMAALCLLLKVNAQVTTLTIKGKIIDENGRPVPGTTITAKGQKLHATANADGIFILNQIAPGISIVITSIGYQTKEIKNIQSPKLGTIIIMSDINQLKEIEILNTGYQNIPKERATGSFAHIDNKLLNRSISTNILERLDGVTSGLIFNKNINISNNTNPSTITIRGRSTILANPNPLIVVDNFPYEGNINTINPNDIESVTVLKDAAASSIWGAFSGNGVIVITTKKGKYNQAPKISFNTNLTIGDRPDLKYTPQISSSHAVDLQQYLYSKGYYNSKISSTSRPSLPPIIDILVNRKNGLISKADSMSQIDALRTIDTRDEMGKYLFRKSVSQQYALNITGGGDNNQYYLGMGYDKNLENNVRNDLGRFTLNANNTYTAFNKKLELTTGIVFTRNKTSNNGIASLPEYYPYLKFADADGNSLVTPNTYRQSYIDTVGRGKLLDWHYRPLDELANKNNTTNLTEYKFNVNLKYHVLQGVDISGQYQYNNGNSVRRIYYSQQTYTTRDLINSFTQLDGRQPIPLGGILDNSVTDYTSQNLRAQLDYSHTWNKLHQLTALAGYEVRDFNSNSSANRLYGYDDNLRTSSLVDYITIFSKIYGRRTTANITANNSELGATNRYTSYFANAAYTFDNRYTLSGSARRDASNLFGVKTNEKGVPLWSLGASWLISNEKFYNSSILPYLRLRLTNGYNGNVDKTMSALITAIVSSSPNIYNAAYSTVSNPPNEKLRWEKINTTNLGLDFEIANFLSGGVEYYFKKGRDIIGSSTIDPTSGMTTFKGNTANISVNGLDLNLTSVNFNKTFKWNTTLLFSYAKDKITKYLLKPTSLSDPLSGGLSPIEGNPIYSLYSLKWAGLDSLGSPLVYYNGKISNEYSAIYNATDLANLVYEGPRNPTVYGSIRNDFEWKQFHLSLNIIYKLNYYFRRPSLIGSEAFPGSILSPDADYLNRWQNKGDELKTDVPALVYPANAIRDAMYKYSSILTEKGDHIRLQDIQIGYMFKKSTLSKWYLSNLEIYGYINNLGILWKANNADLDPDNVPNGALIYPNPRTYSLGIRASF